MFGLGGTILTVVLSMTTKGVDPICFYSSVICNCTVGCAVLAYYLKHKDSESLAAGLTAIVGGITEPTIFGVGLKDKNVLIASVAGSFAGGFLMYLFSVKTFAVASFGILVIIATIGEGSSIILAAISMLVACIIGFGLYYILSKKSNS